VKTLDLAAKRMTLGQVLALAEEGALRILTTEGRTLVLEEADDFEKEVKLLGKSKKFQRFLNRRSKEPATMSLKDYRKSID
jgi:hypothetical protein